MAIWGKQSITISVNSVDSFILEKKNRWNGIHKIFSERKHKGSDDMQVRQQCVTFIIN